ncbi:hypothetical protein VPH35_031654 [Triticum aestivum]
MIFRSHILISSMPNSKIPSRSLLIPRPSLELRDAPPPPPPAWSQWLPRVSPIDVAVCLCSELDGSPANKRLFVSPPALGVARHCPRLPPYIALHRAPHWIPFLLVMPYCRASSSRPSSMRYLKRECLGCFMYCLKTTCRAILPCFMYCLKT